MEKRFHIAYVSVILVILAVLLPMTIVFGINNANIDEKYWKKCNELKEANSKIEQAFPLEIPDPSEYNFLGIAVNESGIEEYAVFAPRTFSYYASYTWFKVLNLKSGELLKMQTSGRENTIRISEEAKPIGSIPTGATIISEYSDLYVMRVYHWYNDGKDYLELVEVASVEIASPGDSPANP